MAEERNWFWARSEEFQTITRKLSEIEVQTTTLMLNLFRRDSLIADLKAQKEQLEVLEVELKQILASWLEHRIEETFAEVGLASLESAFAVSKERIGLLLKIRIALFPNGRNLRFEEGKTLQEES